jgi:hypothetical protein
MRRLTPLKTDVVKVKVDKETKQNWEETAGYLHYTTVSEFLRCCANQVVKNRKIKLGGLSELSVERNKR